MHRVIQSTETGNYNEGTKQELNGGEILSLEVPATIFV